MFEKINNLPKYAEDKKYIVAREIEGELWFWGAYDDLDKAVNAATEIRGQLLVK